MAFFIVTAVKTSNIKIKIVIPACPKNEVCLSAVSCASKTKFNTSDVTE
jgi:hypothetical protein